MPSGRAETRSLGNPSLLWAIDALRERDDLGRRAVVDVELEDPGAGMALGKFEDVVVVGPAEPVDRLGVVADGREVARAGGRDRLDHVDLNGVGVLHLVDQDVPKHPRLRGALVGKLADQAGPTAGAGRRSPCSWRASLRSA